MQVTVSPTHNKLRDNLPPLPKRMRSLPVDDRGYVVPWFVADIDGKFDFRVMDGRKWTLAVGPMCGVNRVSAEPPSHKDCAEFSAKACPFLTMPKMIRREAGIPEDARLPAGVMIRRNPGVALLWHTRTYQAFEVPNGALIRMGEPFEVAWWTEGRPSTREEVEEAINSGLPLLLEACDAEATLSLREEAKAQLEKQRLELWPLLPAAA